MFNSRFPVFPRSLCSILCYLCSLVPSVKFSAPCSLCSLVPSVQSSVTSVPSVLFNALFPRSLCSILCYFCLILCYPLFNPLFPVFPLFNPLLPLFVPSVPFCSVQSSVPLFPRSLCSILCSLCSLVPSVQSSAPCIPSVLFNPLFPVFPRSLGSILCCLCSLVPSVQSSVPCVPSFPLFNPLFFCSLYSVQSSVPSNTAGGHQRVMCQDAHVFTGYMPPLYSRAQLGLDMFRSVPPSSWTLSNARNFVQSSSLQFDGLFGRRRRPLSFSGRVLLRTKTTCGKCIWQIERLGTPLNPLRPIR